jgi:peroxiredoxin
VIEVGAPAPEFTLSDQDANRVSLSDFVGRRLVLVFYPLDFSPVCTEQLTIYQEVLQEFEAQDASLVGISVDSRYCHGAFGEKLNLTIPLLADFQPRGEIARAYGTFNEEWGTANRSLALIGADGTVQWTHLTLTPEELPGANLIFDALAEAPPT